ncbi:MAG: DUF2793 domain-containing protein, partial [Phycisphaerae bacterium]
MTTPITGMPEISESQANKYLTHNEALRRIEALSFRALSRTTTDQPSSPDAGDVYILPDDATGDDWNGEDGNVAYYDGSVWNFITPFEGLSLWISDDDEIRTYDGSEWVVAGDSAVSAHAAETETHGAPSGERLVHTGDADSEYATPSSVS